jgi:phenylalanyl-tRNA synthetase alpha chain
VEERLNNTEKDAIREIGAARTMDEVERIRIKYLGRKGILARFFKELGTVTGEKRPAAGQAINRLKKALAQDIKQRGDELLSKAGKADSPGIDITMPGAGPCIGSLHPVTKTLNDICGIFSHMGFAVIEGPEIETEFNNFEALNIPPEHPSRDTFDTFYIDTKNFDTDIDNRRLLRSHTSPMQIRYMRDKAPPFSIVVPGKVFRPDATDASHSFMFYQVEGLVVGKDINFANLKWTLFEFARQYFGTSSKLRLRPHFFPFTEPSAEADISCVICNGAGCRVCSQSGWLEILGAGMVDPNVFRAVNIDTGQYSGFAFGMGVERIAMLKHGIDDIRLLYENDIRFLKQF